MSWTVKQGIKTPKGIYVPKTDNLIEELKAAAAYAGFEKFNVKIDGNYVDSPADLHTNSIAALAAEAAVENAIEEIEVEARDTAGF